MISRIWHGITTIENADKYENLLKSEVFAGNDFENAVVPEEAQKLLVRFDNCSQHYDLRVENKPQKQNA